MRSATPNSSRSSPSLLKVSDDTIGIRNLFAALDLLNAVLNFIADVVRYALQCRQGKLGCEPRPNSSNSRSRKDGFDVIKLLPKDPEEVCALAEQVSC